MKKNKPVTRDSSYPADYISIYFTCTVLKVNFFFTNKRNKLE